MKDTQQWISIVIGIGYLIFRMIRVIGSHKAEPVHQPDWEDEEDEIEEETLPEREEIKWPIEKIKEITKHEKEIRTSLSQVNQTDASTNKSSKSISDPSYPGIQKLLLPMQEQNPYKLYKATTTRHGKKLNQVLNKHSTSHKIIILAELFRRKTWF
ncbi:MAG: hypothetical protein BGO68_05315 [Candidatus Amoebophilus sp. 36-38]|nr:MAG: hypothetical protein BGO68_05315 [Candidatus Amoebophilus sp. 36-38]